MLTISHISKAYGAKTLFSQSSLQINEGDRIGLVGPNGAGKTTLLKMILGQIEPDTGTIRSQRNAKFGYLPQETTNAGEESVLELVTALTEEHAALRQIVVKENGDANRPGISVEEAHHRFGELNGYQLEAEAVRVLHGLGFSDDQLIRPADALSGGWLMRAHLARLLLLEPHLLMLDEPTNHLDLPSLLWFQDYLKKYRGALLLISHDREFLNRSVDLIVEAGRGTLTRYRGNYDSYLEQKSAAEEQTMAAYKNQQKEINRLMTFVNRFRAKNTKASQAQSKLKQIERMNLVEAPQTATRKIRFAFPQPQRSGLRVLRLIDVAHAYGEETLYRELNFEIERGQRIGLVGPNGAGKTTLLKLLAETFPIQSGQRILGANVQIGYYSQHRVEMLDESRSVLEEALGDSATIAESYARDVLGGFLFSGDDVFKPVRVLSGGEKSRLALVRLLLNPPNLLLMDEPTTHLDINSIEALIYALEQYEGALVFVSHNAHMLRSLARNVVHVENGRLIPYAGDYGYYLDKRLSQDDDRKPEAASHKTSPNLSAKERRRAKAQDRQQRAQRISGYKSQVEYHEREIIRIEAHLTELGKKLMDPAIYRDAASAKALKLEEKKQQKTLQLVTAEWERAVDEYSEAMKKEESD